MIRTNASLGMPTDIHICHVVCRWAQRDLQVLQVLVVDDLRIYSTRRTGPHTGMEPAANTRIREKMLRNTDMPLFNDFFSHYIGLVMIENI